jgi:hypothetical protein
MNPDHNPAPPHDGADTLFDANLRSIGMRTAQVPAPSEAQLQSWRTNDSHQPLHLAGESHPRRRPRWLAWGTAMAACIAAGAVILLQPWGNKVEASTIISGLRTKEFGGVNILFDHVVSQGTTIDGLIQMRLKDPISIDRLDDPKAVDANARLGIAYGKFTLTSIDAPTGTPGGVINAEGAITPTSGWMFIRASDAAAKQLAESNPIAAPMAEMAQHGMVLNIGGLDERFFDGLTAMVCPAPATSGGLHTSIQRLPDGHGAVSIGMRLHPAGGESAEQLQRLIGLAKRVLSGKARQGELEQMKSTLQNDFSQHATVQTLGANRYLLTTDLPAAADTSDSSGGTLRVLYEQSGGVLWAELTNMPDAKGTIRIEFDGKEIPAELLAYERLVDTGRTNYLDLRVVMRMFMPPLLRLW